MKCSRIIKTEEKEPIGTKKIKLKDLKIIKNLQNSRKIEKKNKLKILVDQKKLDLNKDVKSDYIEN